MTDPVRRLVLIRHAKAVDADKDVDRPLSPRGRRDAATLGGWLHEHGVRPTRIVLSPALRARETWEGAATALSDPPGPVVDERIYANSRADLAEIVSTTTDDVQTLVLVGHNPSMGELAAWLDDGAGDSDARHEMTTGLPTNAAAIFAVASSWADVGAGAARLEAFAAPRSG
jgi:phosphohistidine phosphatase